MTSRRNRISRHRRHRRSIDGATLPRNTEAQHAAATEQPVDRETEIQQWRAVWEPKP